MAEQAEPGATGAPDPPAGADPGAIQPKVSPWLRLYSIGLSIFLATLGTVAVFALFLHGDFEERTIVMRSLAVADVGPATVELLGEAQRTNTQTHFEACVCDSNLVARAVGQRDFKTNDAYKTLLKGAFVGLPLDRFFGILDHASPELARMVEGLASERRAAGRAVWPDTDRVVAACGS